VRHAAVAALLLVTTLVYAPSLNHPFQYDDGHTLAANAALRQPGAWRAAFTGTSLSSAETAGGHYRPLTYLSYWATFRLAGPSPIGFHAGNLALHLVAVSLLIVVVGRLTGDGRVGFVAGAIAALHPAQSEAVLYASSRAGLLAAVGSLSALWCLIRAREAPLAGRAALGWTAGLLLLAVLALLSKETAAALPFLCFAADRFVLLDRSRAISAWTRWAPYALLAVGLAVYAGMTGLWRPAIAAFGTPGAVGRYTGVVVQQVEAIGLALRLFLIPWPLSVDHPLPAWPAPGAVLLWALALLPAGFGAVAARSSSPSPRAAGLFAVWALVVALPTLLWPLNVPFQEHRAYLQDAGLAALAALGLIRLIDARPVLRRPAVAAGALVATLFSWTVVERGRAWADPVALWSGAASRAPGSYRAQANAGLAFAAAGRWDEAERALTAALVISPDYPPALVVQGVAAQRRGDRDAARAAYLRALDVAPGYVPALYNLGLIAQASNNLADAERWYRRALAVNPLHTESLLNLSALLLVQRRWDEADTALRAARAASPDSPGARYHSGVLAELTGAPDTARRFYQDAERLATTTGNSSLADAARARLAALP
jgi:tetratricopeptide (TPR) repeat protein